MANPDTSKIIPFPLTTPMERIAIEDWQRSKPAFLVRRSTQPHDEYLWADPLTPQELSDFRAWMNSYPDDNPDEFTCDNCPHAASCVLAFDNYNTDGYCLYEK